MKKHTLLLAAALSLTGCGNANALNEQDALGVIQAYQATYPKENRQCQQVISVMDDNERNLGEQTSGRLYPLANMMVDTGLLTRGELQQTTNFGSYYTYTATPEYERDFKYVPNTQQLTEGCAVNYRAEKINKMSVDGDIATVTTISRDDGTTPWNQNAELVKTLGIPAVKTDAIQVFTLVKSGDAWNVQSVQNQ